jgi:hypothetical protein
MSLTTVGQVSNETAKTVYWLARLHIDAMVKRGLIPAAKGDVAFAKEVAKRLTSLNLRIPAQIAKDAALAAPSIVAKSTAAVASPMAGTAIAVAKASGAQVFRRTLASSAPVAAVVFAVQGGRTAFQYAVGDIDGAEAGRRTAESAAANVGGVGGAAAGAALGSLIFPGVGTVIGGILGGRGCAMGSERLLRVFTRAPATLVLA